MNLNSIRLTPGMVADLYAHTLLEGVASSPAARARIRFLGDNRNKILVVAASPSKSFLTEEEVTFLTSILGACKLSLGDVGVVNWAAAGENGGAVLEQVPATRVILFGVDPETFGLPLQFPPFQTQDFDKRTYLFAPPLAMIAKDIPLKKQLWEALKRLFQL